ncbi:MAG TPA: cytidine deaminase [Bacillota bacterium]|nr:cytidine deaminase [Bacillota bacterium]
MNENQKQELIQIALNARQRAYAPYSHFQVGAALLGKSGRIYNGCNVENASFGATICAERTAAVKAVSEGETEFEALVVATDGEVPAAPCGICRQFLAEFGLDLVLILVNLEGKKIETTLAEYLPGAFVPKSLDESMKTS